MGKKQEWLLYFLVFYDSTVVLQSVANVRVFSYLLVATNVEKSSKFIRQQ